MNLLSLDAGSHATLQGALVQRGMDPAHADAAARGVTPMALIVEGIDADARERIADAARRAGVEHLTGDGWVLLSGGAARLAGLARPDVSVLPAEVAEQLARLSAAPFERPERWLTGHGAVPLNRPVIVGILNLTPDSFSDGGRYAEPSTALTHAGAMLDAGAHMLDVGAESTRPGRPEPVAPAEEWRRLEPVLAQLAARFPDTPVSVDTVKAETARRALAAGAWAINDVSGLRLDPEIADVCAEHEAGLVLMHSRGTVSDMATYDHATYEHVAQEVTMELERAVTVAKERGVRHEAIVVDPGFGFAKRPEHNFAVLRELSTLHCLGLPLMVGPSRKRFLGDATGRDVAAERDEATAAACVAAYERGASFFRVHAVRPTADALAVARAVRGA
ncbi:MAG: dihydropteroate synthase [Gemmatimonadales bacterium]